MKLEDKFSEGVDQNSNDIFALDFVSDNDGIVVGEYGPFGTGTIGTRDQDGNNGYFIYETNDGGNKLETVRKI